MTARVRPQRGRSSAAQGGFTMVELMVALLISTVLVAMILSVYMRMSAAYRSQQQISELQQVLQAAQTTVQQDVRLAGYEMAQGFAYASDTTGTIRPAIRVVNSATAPDELYVYYADGASQATVTNPAAGLYPTTGITVDSAASFVPNDLVVWVNVSNGQANPLGPKDVDLVNLAATPLYQSCVLQISSIAGNTITFSTAAPWGKTGNAHCSPTKVYPPPTTLEPIPVPTMIYKFVARGYRIDPTRKALSVFQRSPSGGLVASDWQDLGIGFTDFQIATRWYHATGGDTPDLDTDALRDWYSGAMQTTLTAPYTGTVPPAAPVMPTTIPIVATMSFAVRTTRPVEGITTPATPSFVDSARVDNGMVGDRPSAMLNGVPDASRAVENRGNNVYRYSSNRVDLRNMGVGL